jgi:hypothetical protein
MSPRNFVTVTDSDTEIVEEVGSHRRTKRGMKSTYKKVLTQKPPLWETAGQASRSRSKKKRQPQLPEVGAAQSQPSQVDNRQTHVFVEGPEDDFPDFVAEEFHVQTMVCSHIFLQQSHFS